MLSDHELDALRDIERRLRWDSPELARLFSTVEPPPPRSRRKRARAKLLVAAAVFTGMALRGPRMLNEAVEVAAEKNSTLVLPFPVELLRFLERATPQAFDRRDTIAASASDPGAPNGDTTPCFASPQIPDDARGLELNTRIEDQPFQLNQ